MLSSSEDSDSFRLKNAPKPAAVTEPRMVRGSGTAVTNFAVMSTVFGDSKRRRKLQLPLETGSDTNTEHPAVLGGRGGGTTSILVDDSLRGI